MEPDRLNETLQKGQQEGAMGIVSKTNSAAEASVSLLSQGRPGSVRLAAALQGLLAVTFLVMPILVYRHGGEAQAAAKEKQRYEIAPSSTGEGIRQSGQVRYAISPLVGRSGDIP